MSQIAILHTQFGVGGAEAVCFYSLEALQTDHEVHLYGLGDPDVQYYNDVFGTSVNDITVHPPPEPDLSFNGLRKAILTLTNGRFGSEGAVQVAALYSLFGHEWASYDLRLITHGELPLPTPAIQYIHHPFFNRWSGDSEFAIDGAIGKGINKILTKYVKGKPQEIRRTKLLTNSNWTAREIETIYGDRPEVVYPPVATDSFEPPDWSEQENGIVTVGRIALDKRTFKACKITEELRDQGYDVHLHLVGPEHGDDAYVEKIRQYANDNKWVTLEGQVNRKALVSLIENHRWAIHPKPREHFGIVVAEYVAGGMIPFVPNSGGQVEIVDGHDSLCYESVDDAVAAMISLLDDPEAAQAVRRSLPDMKERFGAERFKRRLAELVDQEIRG